MPLAYLDTSALLKLVLAEDSEERVFSVIKRTGRICSSVITYAEARAVISRHFADLTEVASGQEGVPEQPSPITANHHRVIADFNALWADVNEVDVTPGIYRLAGDLTVAHPRLRGMDALHLASALEVQKFETLFFLTFDDRLQTAAAAVLGKNAMG